MKMAISANDAWREIGRKLALLRDTEIHPRGEATVEWLFGETTFDMTRPICYHQHRKLNYAFSAAEAYAITHGIPDANFLAKYNKNMAVFSDDGLIFNGAYGPPFHNQIMYAVNSLLNDAASRQSVITIWRQNPVTSADIACTIALQFLIRNSALHVKVTMRSSDVWLGIPYDFFNFTVMALRILTLYNQKTGANIGLGKMNWSAGSSHLYLRNRDALYDVLSELPDKHTSSVPERAFSDWQFVVNSLQACMKKTSTDGLWKIRP
jgi:thymidylate synthase